MVCASDDVSVLRLYDFMQCCCCCCGGGGGGGGGGGVFCFLAEKTVGREGGEASVDCEASGPVCAPLQICLGTW